MPRKLAISLILAATVLGCDRKDGTATSTTSATPTKPTVASTTMPATTQAAASLVWIDQQAHQFPPAKIVVSQKNDQLTAQLFSDDPPSALSDNYKGNSFYLDMSDFEVQDAGSLDGATWEFKAPDSERAESASGIFLQGRRWHLQPFKVHAAFAGTATPMKIELAGQFLMFDDDDARVPGKLVTVRAELEAVVKIKDSGK